MALDVNSEAGVVFAPLGADERAAQGRAARASLPRARHDAFDPPAGRDPLALLRMQDGTRVQELVPIRYGRMLASPFAFYRGSATVMANDLASTPTSRLHVQLCGDAHLANFGLFASPERTLVFDLNDFDETHPGPFEWDVKRLAASFEIAARHRDFSKQERRAAVLSVVRSYRESMRTFAAQTNLEVWYARLDAARIEAELREQGAVQQAKNMSRVFAKAQTKNSIKAFARLSEVVDGEVRIVSAPPLITPIRELLPDDMSRDEVEARLRGLLQLYRTTVQADRLVLLDRYRYVDLARKVVGVGSVGTRCWIVLFLGRDDSDPLFLQVKEAGSSVLEPVLGRSKFENHGQRVVEGQRLMQATSDIFLGWLHAKAGLDGVPRDFYVRQLWDWKSSLDLERILPAGLEQYARVCGWVLARAHARSGDRIAIASYLGKSDAFDRAVADFAATYADVNERDHDRLAEDVRRGAITVTEGV